MLGQYHAAISVKPEFEPSSGSANPKGRYRLKTWADKRADDLSWQIDYAGIQLNKTSRMDVETVLSLLTMKARAKSELTHLLA